MTREERPSSSKVERFHRAMELFDGARALAPDERTAWLASRCAGDEELRAAVDGMLAADGEEALDAGAGLRMLHEQASSGRGSVRGIEEFESHDAAPRVLHGDYRVLGVLGEGGAGVVYEAEQAFPRRRVALKALRAGRASRRALARFEQEAHILGRLQHPGIAQLFEAGSADARGGDQAYLVMELVQGLPLTEYARMRNVPRPEAVELLAQVADAVHHAHQRRVIHRDLKPANILVTAAGIPKVLDFGIARLVEDDAELSRTAEGQIVGTLPYMSPEQIAGDGSQIDARVDVYALGVLLYELLTGQLPHSPQDRSLPELLVAIQNAAPKPPSAHDATIPVDLGAVCLRALEKDRERRYASAAEFAADLRRWASGRPVLARGDSAVYVFAKLVRRHRAVALLAAATLLALAGLAVEATLAARREARNSRALAEALHDANRERGRLLATSGEWMQAEEVLWREQRAQPDERTWWALWELYSAHPVVRTFDAPSSMPIVLASSPNERWLAAGMHDGGLAVWNLEDGSALEIAPRAHSPAHTIAFCGVDRVIALHESGAVTCFDIPSRSVKWTAEKCATIAADPLGARVALGRIEGGISIVEPEKGEEIDALPGLGDGTSRVALAVRGDLLVRGGEIGEVRVLYRRDWDAATRLGSATLTVVALSPDGARLAAGDAEGNVVVLDPTLKGAGKSAQSGCGSIRALHIDRASRRLLVSGSDACAAFELDSLQPVALTPELRQQNSAITLTSDGACAAAASADRRVRVWELEAREQSHALDLQLPEGTIVAVGWEARLLAAARPNGGLEIRRMLDGELVAECKPAAFYLTVAFDEHQRRVVAGGLEPRVDVFDTSTGERVRSLQLSGSPPVTARFAPDENHLAVAVGSEGVEVWNVEQGAVERLLGAETADATRIAFSPDGRRLSVMNKGGALTMWELANGAKIDEVALGFVVSAFRWLGDVHTFAIAGLDGRLVLVDEQRLTNVRTLQALGAPVSTITATSDGRLIAVGSHDGVVRLWDRASGRALVTLDAHTAAVLNTTFDRTGETLWSYHRDGRLLRWDLAGAARCIEANERVFGAAR